MTQVERELQRIERGYPTREEPTLRELESQLKQRGRILTDEEKAARVREIEKELKLDGASTRCHP